MRSHLGPPREFVVRRWTTPHRRAMRILWSAAAIYVGVLALVLARLGFAGKHGNHEYGPWIAKSIVSAAAIAGGVLDFRAPTKRRLLLTVVLGWTAVMVVVVWW